MANYEDMAKQMLEDGSTEKMVKHYLSYIEAEHEEDFKPGYMEWAHRHGFIASHAMGLDIDESNVDNFISDYDFYRCWPHNGWLKMWINDKLTLKYLLQGTKWSSYMPEYYYYITPTGKMSVLVDNPYDSSIDSFKKLLKEKGDFACKPNNGTESVGFYRLTYKDSTIYVNGEKMDEDQLPSFLDECRNYIFTEYLTAGKGLEKVSPLIHTLRVTMARMGDGFKIVGGYVRFPTDDIGGANYHRSLDSSGEYHLYAQVDFATGAISNATKLFTGRKEAIPDADWPLEQGYSIPSWGELEEMTLGIAEYLVDLDFVGFDIGVTPKGFKIMEINGLPGNMGDMFSRDVFDISDYVRFMRGKIEEIDNLSPEDRRARRLVH